MIFVPNLKEKMEVAWKRTALPNLVPTHCRVELRTKTQTCNKIQNLRKLKDQKENVNIIKLKKL